MLRQWDIESGDTGRSRGSSGAAPLRWVRAIYPLQPERPDNIQGAAGNTSTYRVATSFK